MYRECKKMNIVISGASGFIGKHLCACLSAFPDFKVYGLTRNEIIDYSSSVQWLKYDCTVHHLEEILPEKSDIIIHLAQSSISNPGDPKSNQDLFDVNIKATMSLLEYARRSNANHFIYFSSGSVYGKSVEILKENAPLNLTEFYASSKHISEMLVNNYSKFFITTIFRLFFPYGKNQQSFRLIPRLISKIKNKEVITLAGEQGLMINPIHVQDVVNVVVKTIQLQINGLYNLAGMEILSLKKISEIIGAYLGTNPLFEVNEVISDEFLVGDITNLIKALDFSPSLLFSNMIQEVIK